VNRASDYMKTFADKIGVHTEGSASGARPTGSDAPTRAPSGHFSRSIAYFVASRAETLARRGKGSSVATHQEVRHRSDKADPTTV